MRANRLLSILMLLQTKGRMTARELAEQLEVSERTIYRDLGALGMAGIPVYTERGPGGGYSLVDGYQTRLTGLTRAEIRALFLLATTEPLKDLGMTHALEDALLKLSASLSEEARSHIEQTRQRFHIDSSRIHHEENSPSILSLVQDALWNNHRIILVYQQDNGQRKRYLVDPYGLVAKAGEWYLVGANAGTQHTFSIARILLIEATEQAFERPEDFDLATYWTEYQAQCEQCSKQVYPHIAQAQYQRRAQNRQQRRVIKTPKEKKPYVHKCVLLAPSQKKRIMFLKKTKMASLVKKSYIKKHPCLIFLIPPRADDTNIERICTCSGQCK